MEEVITALRSRWQNPFAERLRETAVKAGMVTLFQDAWQKVAAGVTTIAEVMGKVPFLTTSHI